MAARGREPSRGAGQLRIGGLCRHHVDCVLEIIGEPGGGDLVVAAEGFDQIVVTATAGQRGGGCPVCRDLEDEACVIGDTHSQAQVEDDFCLRHAVGGKGNDNVTQVVE